ncbi:O-antigen ligase family protein [Paracoccus tegillarcae]|uniref:O-antigen ligase-related domain-containing protein n=1 Tax=Paracoccus tegillarcae TaxID=1529068 RepID=A0A2K9EDZ8_9RHOB|nr:O-antigen ligase family protein [Paracoccus tegillarcae]AUH33183.1 hypothetical protein CUV01_07070 [Paracoccus tegillarcae]
MVSLTAYDQAAAPRRVALARGGQRAVWRLYDTGLALMVLIAAGDLPNRWGLTSELWMLIYGAALLRILSVWPAYFRLLARNWTYLLYPAVCLLSVAWSVVPKVSLVGGIQISMSVLIACYLGWRFDPRRLMILAFSTLFFGSVLSMLNYLSGGAISQPLYSDVGGLLGIYTNKNMLGHYGAMATVLALTFVLTPRGQIPSILRAAALVALVLCPIAVLLSKSMTAILLLPIYLALTLLLNRRRLAGWLRHGAIAALVLAVALAPVLMTLVGFDPMAELFARTGKDATLTGRTELWSIAAGEISKAPLTGYGFQAFWTAERFESVRFLVLRAGATAPTFHNFIADTGIGTGLLGIAAICTLVLTSLRRVLRVWRLDGSPLAIGCLITVLMPVNVALVEPYLYRQHEFMMAWLIMIGVSLGRARTSPVFMDKFLR